MPTDAEKAAVEWLRSIPLHCHTAVLLALIAYGFSFFQKILWLAFKIGGITFGSLLGVFLLGLLTTRKSNRANVLAMTFMAAVTTPRRSQKAMKVPASSLPRITTSSSTAPRPTYSMPRSYWSEKKYGRRS